MTLTVNEVLGRAQLALDGGAAGMAERLSDCTRVARLAVLAGSRPEGFGDLVMERQQEDGGWTDIEETAWCAAALPVDSASSRAGLAWIGSNRATGGGWGRSRRDVARVPTTGLVLRLHGDLGLPEDWTRLEEMWANDLRADVVLTYKGAMYLMCQPQNPCRNYELERSTLDFLEANLNSDGGFGPWRGHPVGSDPWVTGLCLVGLSAVFPDSSLLEPAARWLSRSQLDSGHWRFHFIDEGTVYAFWGLSEAAPFIAGL